MFKHLAIITALLIPAVACSVDAVDPGNEMGPAGGKADDTRSCDSELDELCESEFGGGWECDEVIPEDEALVCCIGSSCELTGLPDRGDDDRDDDDQPADEPADGACPGDVFVTHAAHDDNDHVISNCHNAETGKFVAKSCCADEMELIADITGCPSQVRFNSGTGTDKRCIDDASGTFVPTACCAPLCGEDAAFNDDGLCFANDGSGQFDEPLCCHRNEKLEGAGCEGAAWEQLTAGPREGDFACRNEAGRFALNVCCVEECAEQVSRSPSAFPGACEEAALAAAAGDECPADSGPNSAGICHNPDNGQFVKAACCDFRGRTEGLDRVATDECVDGRRDDCE